MTTIIDARSSLIDDARRLSRQLGDLIRVAQFRDRDRTCCYDVSVSQCYALEAVATHEGLTVNDLAAHLYLDKSTASRVANGLVELGYVNRKRSPEDGRVVQLVLTRRGERLRERIAAELAEDYASLLADLEPAVRGRVVEVVGRLARRFAARVETEGGTCRTVC